MSILLSYVKPPLDVFSFQKMTSWDDDWWLKMAILCPFCSTDDCRQYTFFENHVNTFSEHIAAKPFFSEQYAARSVLGLRGMVHIEGTSSGCGQISQKLGKT